MPWLAIALKAPFTTEKLLQARGATITVSILYRERRNDNPDFGTSNIFDGLTGKHCRDGHDQSQHLKRQHSGLFSSDGKPVNLSAAAYWQWICRVRC